MPYSSLIKNKRKKGQEPTLTDHALSGYSICLVWMYRYSCDGYVPRVIIGTDPKGTRVSHFIWVSPVYRWGNQGSERWNESGLAMEELGSHPDIFDTVVMGVTERGRLTLADAYVWRRLSWAKSGRFSPALLSAFWYLNAHSYAWLLLPKHLWPQIRALQGTLWKHWQMRTHRLPPSHPIQDLPWSFPPPLKACVLFRISFYDHP